MDSPWGALTECSLLPAAHRPAAVPGDRLHCLPLVSGVSASPGWLSPEAPAASSFFHPKLQAPGGSSPHPGSYFLFARQSTRLAHLGRQSPFLHEIYCVLTGDASPVSSGPHPLFAPPVVGVWPRFLSGHMQIRAVGLGLDAVTGVVSGTILISSRSLQVCRQHGEAADRQPAQIPRQRHLPDPGAAG